jgi:hypothetical protein
MAAEPRTLLTRDPIDVKDPQAWFWVVSNNRDFRLSLATLLSFIDKTTLGLDRVDNTADSEKPISNPTQEALDQKADKNQTITREEYAALLESIDIARDEAWIESVNTAIASISQALTEKVSTQHLNIAISQALAPLASATDTLIQRFSEAEAGQSETLVTRDILTDILNTLRQSIMQAVTQAIDQKFEPLDLALSQHLNNYGLFVQATGDRLQVIEAAVAGIDELVEKVQLAETAITDHGQRIVALEEKIGEVDVVQLAGAVTNIQEQITNGTIGGGDCVCEVTVGPNQW